MVVKRQYDDEFGRIVASAVAGFGAASRHRLPVSYQRGGQCRAVGLRAEKRYYAAPTFTYLFGSDDEYQV
jgi:hypothetical protein